METKKSEQQNPLSFYRQSLLKAIIKKFSFDVNIGTRAIAKRLGNVSEFAVLNLFKLLEQNELLTAERRNKRSFIYHINPKVMKWLND